MIIMMMMMQCYAICHASLLLGESAPYRYMSVGYTTITCLGGVCV